MPSRIGVADIIQPKKCSLDPHKGIRAFFVDFVCRKAEKEVC
jgi:hypothetical protein